MACSIIYNKETGKPSKVFAPNGKESILYKNALDQMNDPELALDVWATVYTQQFKLAHGDWETQQSIVELDQNGEPMINHAMSMYKGYTQSVTTDFRTGLLDSKYEIGSVGESSALKLKSDIEENNPNLKVNIDLSEGNNIKMQVAPRNSNIVESTTFTKSEIENQKQPINTVLDRLITNFPGLTYEWVKPSSLKQKDHYENVKGIKAFVRNNKIYLVEGRAKASDALEEISHVFVEMVRQNKPALFKGLLDAAKEDPRYVETFEDMKSSYGSKLNDITINSEFLSKSIKNALQNEIAKNPEGRAQTAFGKLVQRFLDWLKNLLNIAPTGSTVGQMAIDEIASFINTKGVEIDLPSQDYMYYSAENPLDEPHDDKEQANTSAYGQYKTANELNKERAEETITFLEGQIARLSVNPLAARTDPRINTLNILLQNQKDAVTVFENNTPTISASKYTGAKDLEIRDPKATETGAKFGTFLHAVLDAVVKEYNEKGAKTSPLNILNQPGWLTRFMEGVAQKATSSKSELKFKDLILIDQITTEDLQEMLNDIVANAQKAIVDGDIILPELSLLQSDLNGRLVLGRVDLMTINPKGEISNIFDLKSTLRYETMTQFPIVELNKPYHYSKSWKPGADRELADIRDRSKVDEYNMQTSLYGEMANALGIKYNGKHIGAIAIEVAKTADGKVVYKKNYKMRNLTNLDFHSYDSWGQSVTNNRADAIEKTIRSKFRLPEQVNAGQNNDGKQQNPFALLQEGDATKLISVLTELADKQIQSLENEIEAVNKNTGLSIAEQREKKDPLSKRLFAVRDQRSKLQQGVIGESEEDMARAQAILIKTGLDVFEHEIENALAETSELSQSIPAKLDMNNPDHANILKTSRQRSLLLDAVKISIENFETAINQSDVDKDIKNNINGRLGTLLSSIKTARNPIAQLNRKVVKAILFKSLGENQETMNTFTKVMGQQKLRLQPVIEELKQQISDIENGVATPEGNILTKTGRVISSFIKGTERKEVTLESLKTELQKLESISNFDKLDDTTLDAYLDGIFNTESSPFYIGQTIGANSSMPIDMDALIASSLNSEAIIGGMWKFLYTATQKAMQDFENDAYNQKVDEIKNKAIDHAGGIENLNKRVSEKLMMDGEEHDFFIAPYVRYHQTMIDTFLTTRSELNDKIKLAQKEVKTITDTAQKAAKDTEIKDLIKQKNENEKAYVDFQIKYLNNKKKDEVLMLENASGQLNADIAAMMNEVNDVYNRAGTDKETAIANLTQDDIDKLEELDVRIAKKRQELKQTDPDGYEKLKQYMTFYEIVPNYNYFEKIRSTMIAAYGENSDKYKNWLERSVDLVPTKEWNDKMKDIYEGFANLGSDPTLKSIGEEQSEIKRKYIVNGKFNPNWMDEEDAEKYNKLQELKEQRLEELREAGPMEPILADLVTRLGNISEKKASPAYLKKFKELRDKVELNHRNSQRIQQELDSNPNMSIQDRTRLQDEKQSADQQYMVSEQIFSDFFNKANYTEYVFGSIASGVDLNENRKPHILVRQPKYSSDMEEVPNKRFRVKRLKDEALNLDYQDSFDQMPNGRGFYPYPKGMRFNDQTNEFEISANVPRFINPETGQSESFVNDKFLQMNSDPILKEFYKDWIVKNFLVKQSKASGNRLGFHFPFQDAGLAENIRFKGVAGIANEVKQKVQEASLPNSEYEKASGESGMGAVERIKFPSNYRMKSELNSPDGVGSILSWNKDYHVNKSMAQASIYMDSTIDFISDLNEQLISQKKFTEAKKIETIKKQLEFERDKFVYGRLYEKSAKDVGKVFNRKTAQILMRVASTTRMAWDIPMQMGNLFAGNIQAFLSTCDSRLASSGDFVKGKGYVYSSLIPNMISDYGKFSDVSFETKKFRWWNPSSKDLSKQLDMNTANKVRRVANKVFNVGEVSTMLQDKGEFEIGATTWAAILEHHKYEKFKVDVSGNVERDANGNPVIEKDASGDTVYVSGHDILEEKPDGSVDLRNDVNISEDQALTLSVAVITEITRFQGNYATAHRSKFGGTLMGSLVEFYRKYLIPAVSVRFGGLGNTGGYEGIGSAYSWNTQECWQGWYTILFQMFKLYGPKEAFKAMVLQLVPKSMRDSIGMTTRVNSYYAPRAMMAAREVLVAFLAYILYEGIRALVMSSDEDDLSYAEMMLLKSFVKVTNESRSLAPVPVVGKVGDYIDNFGQFTNVFKEAKTLSQLADHSLFYLAYNVTGSQFAYERGYYLRDSGRYEKGDPKVLKNLSDLTGWSNIVGSYDPYKDLRQAVTAK